MDPRVLVVDPAHPDPRAIADAVRVLRSGGLVAFPTETVYGLGARALDPTAVERIFLAKGRPSNHPVIAHVLGADEARGLANPWTELASQFARAFWPGPLTLVVGRAPQVPASLGGGTETVGIRAPRHPVARALLAALGEPIAAPSANRYQALSPTQAQHVVLSLGDKVDLVLDGGACAEGLESTVLDVRGESPVILRPGTLDLAALRTVDPRVVHAEGASVTVPERLERASPGMDPRHYAPRAPVTVAASRSEAVREAETRGESGKLVGLVLLGTAMPEGVSIGVRCCVLPDDPAGYARELYAALHDLDAQGVASIVIQAVPSSEAWHAVADRVRRASTG
jgi:L-threonylcarbamoyladenylate synthase